MEYNSKNLYENGQKILKLADELENNINYIFNRIEGMPSLTLEWQGMSAINFVKSAKQDKKQYKNFIKSLRSYGNSLLNQAEKIEICCRKVEL